MINMGIDSWPAVTRRPGHIAYSLPGIADEQRYPYRQLREGWEGLCSKPAFVLPSGTILWVMPGMFVLAPDIPPEMARFLLRYEVRVGFELLSPAEAYRQTLAEVPAYMRETYIEAQLTCLHGQVLALRWNHLARSQDDDRR